MPGTKNSKPTCDVAMMFVRVSNLLLPIESGIRSVCQCFLINFGVSKDAAHFYPLRRNRSVRFGFSVATVLLACSGYQVSCYTTEGGGVALLKAGWGLEGVGF